MTSKGESQDNIQQNELSSYSFSLYVQCPHGVSWLSRVPIDGSIVIQNGCFQPLCNRLFSQEMEGNISAKDNDQFILIPVFPHLLEMTVV